MVSAGLCADCIHARKVTSGRGSEFLLCDLAAVDPRFRKYPALPVRQCEGFAEAPLAPAGD